MHVLYNRPLLRSGMVPPTSQIDNSFAMDLKLLAVSPPGMVSAYCSKYLTPYGELKHSYNLHSFHQYTSNIYPKQVQEEQ